MHAWEILQRVVCIEHRLQRIEQLLVGVTALLLEKERPTQDLGPKLAELSAKLAASTAGLEEAIAAATPPGP